MSRWKVPARHEWEIVGLENLGRFPHGQENRVGRGVYKGGTTVEATRNSFSKEMYYGRQIEWQKGRDPGYERI